MSETPILPDSAVKPRWNLTLAVIVGKYRWDTTLIEILVILVMAVVLYVLLSSPVEYVADGTRQLPVQVFVFDVDTGEPVRGAKVVVTRAPGVYSSDDLSDAAQRFRHLREYAHPHQGEPQIDGVEHGETDDHGLVTVQHTFSSSYSHKHPDPRVYQAKCWIAVSSDHFSGVVVSLGQDMVSVGDLKRRGGFLVPIGIMRDKTPVR
jgi:hypothetical protein